MSDQQEPGTEVSTEIKSDLPTPPASKLDLSQIKMNPFGGGGTIVPGTLEEALNFATLMAKSDFCIPVRFRMNPGACLAVSQYAWRWAMDPFAVAWKTYITKDKSGNERLAFEAQLVAAVVNTRAPIVGRLRVTYEGEGQNRVCICSALFKGDKEDTVLRSPPIGKITIKNSPLWISDPDQQQAYYTQRAFGRRNTPEVLLGVYTPEEVAVLPGDPNAPRGAALPGPEEAAVADLSFLDDDVTEASV